MYYRTKYRTKVIGHVIAVGVVSEQILCEYIGQILVVRGGMHARVIYRAFGVSRFKYQTYWVNGELAWSELVLSLRFVAGRMGTDASGRMVAPIP